MYYVIDYSSLWKLIDEETSRVADKSYTEQGASQYDLIHLTSQDQNAIRRLIDDSVSKLVARLRDICKYSPLIYYAMEGGQQTDQITSITPRIQFYVPDMDEKSEEPVREEVTRYIVFYVTASHLGEKSPDRAQQYVDLSAAALDKANLLLRTRKPITESW